MTNYHPLDVHIGRFLLFPNGIRTIGPNALIKKCKRNNYIQKQLIEFISRDFFSSWLCDNNRKKHGDNVDDFRQSSAASFFLSRKLDSLSKLHFPYENETFSMYNMNILISQIFCLYFIQLETISCCSLPDILSTYLRLHQTHTNKI